MLGDDDVVESYLGEEEEQVQACNLYENLHQQNDDADGFGEYLSFLVYVDLLDNNLGWEELILRKNVQRLMQVWEGWVICVIDTTYFVRFVGRPCLY